MTRTITITIMLLLVNCHPPSRLTMPSDSEVIFRKINNLRLRHGLPPLRYLHAKQAEVDAWAKRLEKNYGHARHGYRAENIGYCYNRSEQLFELWLNSAPHRRNMLRRGIRYCTISVHVGTHKGIYPTFFGVWRGYDDDFVKTKKHKKNHL